MPDGQTLNLSGCQLQDGFIIGKAHVKGVVCGFVSVVANRDGDKNGFVSYDRLILRHGHIVGGLFGRTGRDQYGKMISRLWRDDIIFITPLIIIADVGIVIENNVEVFVLITCCKRNEVNIEFGDSIFCKV